VENPIQIRYRNQIYEVGAGLTLVEALERLGIDPESVLAIREGEMIGGACRLEAGDEVRLVAVISGGALTPGLGEPAPTWEKC
jgi:sulfur carrier protein ThiS